MGNLPSLPSFSSLPLKRKKLFSRKKSPKPKAKAAPPPAIEDFLTAPCLTEDPALAFPCSDEPLSPADVIKACSLAGLPYSPKEFGPPKPACNDMRARTVAALSAMDAPPNGELDNILKLIQNIFKTPAALVALFDDSRIFVRNGRGFAEGDFPWRWSFCAWTLAPVHHQVLIIEDALQDVRFADNAVALEYGIRFYCGAPLIASNGHRLGTICFIDTKPRKMDPLSCQILNNFAELVVRELEKDIALLLKEQESQAVQALYKQVIRTVDCYDTPVLFTDTSEPQWQLLYANEAWESVTGVARGEILSAPLEQLFEKADGVQVQWAELRTLSKDMAVFALSGIRFKKAKNKLFSLTFRPAGHEVVDDLAPAAAGMPSFVNMDFTQNRQYYFISIKEDQDWTLSASSTKRVASALLPKLPSRQLEGLELGAMLGSGAQGRVYYGTWFGTNVAVKVIETTGGCFSSTGSQEAILSGVLSHPNVVRMLKTAIVQPNMGSSRSSMEISVPDLNSDTENGSSKGSLLSYGDHESWISTCSHAETWMIMEFCDRGSLQDAIDRGWLREDPTKSSAPASEEVVLATAVEIASALQYLHSKDIIHGDLSSFNILLSSTGPGTSVANRGFIAKVADFGLSRTLDINSRINTKTYGTITHMPPELIKDGTLSKSTDVFAFGVLLWQMVTSSRPWANLTHAQIMQAVLSDKHKLVFPDTVPASIAEVGSLCMSYERDDRPNMEWVCQRLQELQEAREMVPHTPEPVLVLEANNYLQSL